MYYILIINELYSGIRSLSFEDNVITIGTSIGAMMFFDMRANRFLSTTSSGRKRLVILRTSNGYVVSYLFIFIILFYKNVDNIYRTIMSIMRHIFQEGIIHQQLIHIVTTIQEQSYLLLEDQH